MSSNIKMITGSDQHVIEQILQGNKRAYALLVDRYKERVFTTALRMMKNREEAEEVAQDTFIKMFKSLANFKGSSKFSTWLYKIAYNTCLDRLKKKTINIVDDAIEDITPAFLATVDSALDIMQEREQQQAINSCLQQLPGDDGFILTLYYFEDLSVDEIAGIVGLKANNIKIKMYRSRKKLAVLLRQHLEPEIILNYEKEH